MDEAHLYAAIRYVERNPVRAGLVKKAEEYPWSSAKAHVFKVNDPLLTRLDNILEINDWKGYLNEMEEESFIETMNKHERTGRPLGADTFIKMLEKMTGRDLRLRHYTRKRGTQYCVPLFK
jgi:putative transposase